MNSAIVVLFVLTGITGGFIAGLLGVGLSLFRSCVWLYESRSIVR